MLLIMEYGNFKPYEVDVFELDHMITYKQFLKFNSRTVLMEVTLEYFLPRKLPAIRYKFVPMFCNTCFLSKCDLALPSMASYN